MSDINTERPVTRRSLPSSVKEAEDEEMFGMSRELHSELKSILEKRASDLSSERPDSIASSEASLQEVSHPVFTLLVDSISDYLFGF